MALLAFPPQKKSGLTMELGYFTPLYTRHFVWQVMLQLLLHYMLYELSVCICPGGGTCQWWTGHLVVLEFESCHPITWCSYITVSICICIIISIIFGPQFPIGWGGQSFIRSQDKLPFLSTLHTFFPVAQSGLPCLHFCGTCNNLPCRLVAQFLSQRGTAASKFTIALIPLPTTWIML
jgi:hypothetical protein